MEYSLNQYGLCPKDGEQCLFINYPTSKNRQYEFYINNGELFNYKNGNKNRNNNRSEEDMYCFIEYEDGTGFKKKYTVEHCKPDIFNLANFILLESMGKMTPQYLMKYILKNSRGKLQINHTKYGHSDYKFKAILHNEYENVSMSDNSDNRDPTVFKGTFGYGDKNKIALSKEHGSYYYKNIDQILSRYREDYCVLSNHIAYRYSLDPNYAE